MLPSLLPADAKWRDRAKGDHTGSGLRTRTGGSLMKFKTLSVVSSLALVACLATPAYAQDDQAPADQQASDEDDARNNVITVTAEFREARLQDTPIAITAVNAEMLENRGQTNIAQVAAQAPNVSLRPQPQNGGSGLIAFIRGVGQVDFNYALDPGVGVYIDDVYIPTLSSSLLELIDLDRIEILRGPQGTLAGKNSIGGAIKLFTQKPKGDGSGILRVGYGAFDELTLRGMADFAVSDNIAVRVSGMSRSRDGYVAMLDYGNTHPSSNVPQNGTRGPGNFDYESMGGQDIQAGRIAIKFEPSDRIELNLSADYTREDSEAIPTVLIAASTAAANFNPLAPGRTLNANGTPFLVGKDGQPIPYDCRFVPAGPYSCDTGGNLLGYDPRYVSYSNFLDGMAPSAMAPFKPYFSLPITEFRGWGVQGNLTIDASDNVQIVYIGSYRAYTSNFGQDQDATPLPMSQLDNELNHWAWTSELRVNFEAMNGFLEGTVGGFYLDQKGTYFARVDLNYVSPVIDFLHGPDTTPSTTKALFATVTVHPTDALSLTGGVRYTKDKKDYTYFRRNPDLTQPNAGVCFGPPFPPASFALTSNCILAGIFNSTGSFRGDRFDYRGVVDYRFSDEFLAYASISTGFKGGGVNPRPFVADQRLPFQPETLTTYEVGFKADLADRRVRLNGAAFLNHYKDIILGKAVCPESSLPSPCLRPDNIGAATVKGLELEASLFPMDGLTFDGSIAILDFEYTSPTTGTPPVLANTSIPATGITPFTPELTWALGGQYDYESDIGTFSIRLDGSYQGKVFANAENTIWGEIPGRFLANARVSWTTNDEDWRVSFEVQNLLDKYYFMSKSDIRTPNNIGGVTGVPGLPRTWQLSVERRF
jgi:iron complex outermembrane receptor protein